MLGVPVTHAALCPRPSQFSQAGATVAMPIPAASVFKIPEAARVTMLAAAPAHRVEQAASAPREREELAKPGSARSRAAASRQATRSKHAAHQAPHVGHAAPKHAAQVKKNG